MTNALHPRYPNVFTPIKLGQVEIRNRIFLPAHTTNFAENFLPTERHLAYLRERAAGGVGLLFMDPLRVHPTALGRAAGLAGASAESLPKLQEITAAMRAEGARVFTQITHTGRHSDNFTDRLPAWGPTPMPWTTAGELPHQMTRSEMAEVRDCYVTTAEFAIDAGFEGIEVHFGHGHLLHQFLSPACNDRTDAYGGSFEARLTYPFEVLETVLDAVGDRVPVGVRVSVADLMAGGCTDAEMTEIIRRVAETPKVAFIHASVAAYHWPSIGHHVADMAHDPHPFLERTLEVAEVTGDVPILAVNRYRSLTDAEGALDTGKVHMVGINRAHMADPRLVRKSEVGQEHRVRPCISNNHCIGQVAVHRPISCMMNPRVGKETAWPATPVADDARRVLVVGGGPAGLEAAHTAAVAGHEVTLWEGSESLGGLLKLAGMGHRRDDLNQMRDFLIAELGDTDVTVELGRHATAQDIADFGADAVILATGAVTETSPAGITRSAEAALADDATDWTGRRVVIVDKNGSWSPLSVAETLAARGAAVTVTSSPDSPFWDVNIYSRMTAMERLSDLGVILRPGLSLKGVPDGAPVFANKFTGQSETLPDVDEVLFASRGVSSFDLQSALEELGVPLRVVGDALAPHSLFEAMHDAQAAARAI